MRTKFQPAYLINSKEKKNQNTTVNQYVEQWRQKHPTLLRNVKCVSWCPRVCRQLTADCTASTDTCAECCRKSQSSSITLTHQFFSGWNEPDQHYHSCHEFKTSHIRWFRIPSSSSQLGHKCTVSHVRKFWTSLSCSSASVRTLLQVLCLSDADKARPDITVTSAPVQPTLPRLPLCPPLNPLLSHLAASPQPFLVPQRKKHVGGKRWNFEGDFVYF